jgi:hypothetical protein
MGITFINIGVGPSNAKTITDHLAVLRPHCWMMLGKLLACSACDPIYTARPLLQGCLPHALQGCLPIMRFHGTLHARLEHFELIKFLLLRTT